MPDRHFLLSYMFLCVCPTSSGERYKGSMTWGPSWIAFDTETTGLDDKARIVEIALVHFKEGEIVEQWSSFLKPEGINWDDAKVKEALNVNKIDPKDLEGAPTFKDVFHRLQIHFRDAEVWVAHNSEFDLRMLNQEHRFHFGADFAISPKLACLCTKLLSNKIHPHERSHRLQDVAPRWGVQQEGAHRAASDAITCGRILHAMRQKNALPASGEDMLSFHKQASANWGSRRRR